MATSAPTCPHSSNRVLQDYLKNGGMEKDMKAQGSGAWGMGHGASGAVHGSLVPYRGLCLAPCSVWKKALGAGPRSVGPTDLGGVVRLTCAVREGFCRAINVWERSVGPRRHQGPGMGRGKGRGQAGPVSGRLCTDNVR